MRVVVALGALLAAAGAHAQVSGTVTLTSDYRWRGISLSDEGPALQLGLAYDTAGGWYAGAMLSSVRRPFGTEADLQAIAYAGYARRMRGNLSWDAGAEYVALVGEPDYNYPEFHVGLASQRLGARLSYAPRYPDRDVPAVYFELNGNQPMGRRLRLLGHLGWQRRGEDGTGDDGGDTRVDAQVGLGIALEPFDLRIAWSQVNGRDERARQYPAGGNDDSGWIVTLSRAW
ncbi:hypothetical protein GCM10027431_17250 [Lysobacter rhizosphaerae]